MIYCPSCGAELRFDITSQQMICEHCRNGFDVENLQDNTSGDAKSQEYYDSYAYVCPSCGAEVDTTDKNDAVGFCPYCKGSSMIFDKLRKEWCPKGIIPFKITKDQCKELYCKEVKKHIFVSKQYRDPALIEDFRGIYMPYVDFVGHSRGDISVRAESDEEYLGNYEYLTKYYDLHGNADFTIKETMSHDASVAFDDHISLKLEPYDKNEIKKFRPAYLSGFYAEVGDTDTNEYRSVVESEMKQAIHDEIINSQTLYHAAENQNLHIKKFDDENKVPLKVVQSDKNLFPVWFMSYRRGEKITYATVNGQTGKVSADLPLSPYKILIAALIFSVAIFAGLMILMNYLPTMPATTTLGVCTMLGLSGMYLMQHSYIRTIGSAFDKKEFNQKLKSDFIVQSLIAIAGLILMTTDGTYAQLRAYVGRFLAAVSLLILIVKFFCPQIMQSIEIYRMKLSNATMQTNGILVEAKKFNIINSVMRAGILFTSFIFFTAILSEKMNLDILRQLPFAISSPQSNNFYYILAFIAAAQLFALAFIHIIFQANISKRRLPQFNKRGAAYDTI